MSVRILIGDCRERMKELPDASVDSVVCDPPYHLTSIVKRFGSENAAPAKSKQTGVYARTSKGFMGQTWDGGDVAFQPETWAEVLRVLKPGGHLVAFSGSRTYHRMACAIEDAGFEIRDQLQWIYGSGFAKSHNLKNHPICDCEEGGNPVAYSHGQSPPQHHLRPVPDADLSAGLNLGDQSREVLFAPVPQQGASAEGQARTEPETGGSEQSGLGRRELHRAGQGLPNDPNEGPSEGAEERLCPGAHSSRGEDAGPSLAEGRGSASSGPRPSEQRSCEFESLCEPQRALARASQTGCGQCPNCGKLKAAFEGFGSALKPAHEPICLARKPLIGSVASNVLKHGTGALNIDGCRIETDWETDPTRRGWQGGGTAFRYDQQPREVDGEKSKPNALGRWPANLCHDGSDEVLAGFPETSDTAGVRKHSASIGYGGSEVPFETLNYGDSGSAARYFYCAKAATEERGEGNNHPTVKPQALMRWLVRLVTPPGGTVLDPFMGSGSTGLAADAEQFDFIGCEMSSEYAAIAEKRIRDAAGMFAEVKAA
jgi:DNA modification methylase